MKRGKEFRDPRGHPTKRDSPNEIPVLMFVMVEQATGALTLRCVSNIAHCTIGTVSRRGRK